MDTTYKVCATMHEVSFSFSILVLPFLLHSFPSCNCFALANTTTTTCSEFVSQCQHYGIGKVWFFVQIPYFFKKPPRALFKIEIRLCFLTLLLAPPLYYRWTVIQSIFYMKGYQNAKFDSKWRYLLYISVWKSLKMAHCVVLFQYFTQYFRPNLFWKV